MLALKVAPSFTVLTEFSLEVPQDYTNEDQISRLKKSGHRNFWGSREELSDKDFVDTYELLTPGQTYAAKIIALPHRRVVTGECTEFLSAQNAIRAGIQGLCLAWMNHRAIFPRGKHVISFGHEGTKVPGLYWWLQEEEGYDASYLDLDSGHIWTLTRGDPTRDWRGDDCSLLCICK
jgi:hypothetical protein